MSQQSRELLACVILFAFLCVGLRQLRITNLSGGTDACAEGRMALGARPATFEASATAVAAPTSTAPPAQFISLANGPVVELVTANGACR